MGRDINDNFNDSADRRDLAFAGCCTGVAAQPQLGICPIWRAWHGVTHLAGAYGAGPYLSQTLWPHSRGIDSYTMTAAMEGAAPSFS